MPDAPSPAPATAPAGTSTTVTAAAVIVAAGRGLRAGGGVPKQFRPLAGRTVLDHAVAAFRAVPAIGPIVVVLPADAAERSFGDGVRTVVGGADRAASVRAGLDALRGMGVARVLIHDAARATVPPRVIEDVLAALDTHDAAAPGLAVTDALWRVGDGQVAGTLPRDGLVRAQTPQGFRYDAILAAHRAHTGGAADDVEVARAAGLTVAVTAGHEDNLKITAPDDMARAARILSGRRGMEIRIGNGFDVHAFGPGDHVTLCGVRVPHEAGLVGHSDADVGMHALTDAILGALAEGDIGRHFPPSEPEWKGAASEIFRARAIGIGREGGWRLGNADVTLICERPKIGPHALAMTAELARICEAAPGQISVKATTSEGLGFTGRSEGIAAMASVTMVRG